MENCEIVKEGKVLEEGSKGWKVEVNEVSWFGREAGFDIRAWDEGHEKCGKGITLSEIAMRNLRDYLNERFPDEDKES